MDWITLGPGTTRRRRVRFTSPDPLLNSGRPWDPQSWNRYAYGRNNPLKNIDPTGLYDWDASLGGSATDDELRSKDGKDKAAGPMKTLLRTKNE